MDLKEYDKLRQKISVKDFEGNNKGLDKWLYGFSFVGNIGSIFFAYFLVFPALLRAISINLVDGFLGTALAFLFTNTFLIIFEIIKRYLIKNFSSDYVANNKKLSPAIFGWFAFASAIVLLSFYLSVVGSKNLATTSTVKNEIAVTQVDVKKDSLSVIYERKKMIYENDNQSLRNVNNELRNTLAQTPINYVSARKDYQTSIDKNSESIENNQNEISKIDEQLKLRINELKLKLSDTKSGNATEDTKNIILFVIIAIFVEVMIIGGVYFREWFEYNLFLINQQKFDKIYLRKDRYKSLLMFVYNGGKSLPGDKVISGLDLKAIVAEKTTIPNSNKFVEEFLHDMDSLGIFTTTGKRRLIASTYNEAVTIIENYDDAFRVLENMK